MNIFDLLITNPFSYVLRFCLDLVQNQYWVALVLFTVFTKVILFPLTVKQKKGMMDQARIQPKVKALEKKYKGNKEKYNEELQNLYRTENVSLFGGCLPLLITIPILFGLYAIIRQPMTHLMKLTAEEIKQVSSFIINGGFANGAQWLESAKNALESGNLNNYQIDLAALIHSNFAAIKEGLPALAGKLIPINFNFFGIPLDKTPSINQLSILWAVPVVSGATSYILSIVTQKTNGLKASQASAGANQTKMMTMMSPMISLFIGFSMPTALSIYWIVSNLCTIAQEPLALFYIRKKYPGRYESAKSDAPLPDIVIEKEPQE